jgi:type VI protein secretion system component Hcp
MTRAHRAPCLRASACTALLLCLLSVAGAAKAVDALHMRMDGVDSDGSLDSPLGKDAFPLRSFTLPLGSMSEDEAAAMQVGPPALADLRFNMPVVTAGMALWRSALEGRVIPKASIAAVDAEGKLRYRIDLEQVTVSSFSFQSFGKQRETLVGSLGFERIRITQGAGKDAVVTGWDRVRKQPWK